LNDLELYFDKVMTDGFQFTWKKAKGVWLVGCWPPQRYVVVDGKARLPSGRMTVRTAGLSFVVSAYDLELNFEKLRADISCHKQSYVLQSVTSGSEGDPATELAITATGEINVRCERGWTVLCLVLSFSQGRLSKEAVSRLPKFIAKQFLHIDNLELGGKCDRTMHNTVSLMTYSSRECCEHAFSEDPWGCLNGGQFNGKVPGVRKAARVVCEPSKLSPGTYTAKCESIPGYYRELSPGMCREVPPHITNLGQRTHSWAEIETNKHWEQIHWGLSALAWADLLLTSAVCWTIALLCCYNCQRCQRPAGVLRRRQHSYS